MKTLKESPRNVEAEKSILGITLVEPAWFLAASEIVSSGDFFDQKHKVVFKAMEDLHRAGMQPNVVGVAEKLNQGNSGVSISWLASLTDIIPLSAELKQAAKIVKGHSTSRKLISLYGDAQENLYAGAEPGEVFSDVTSQSSKLATSTYGKATLLSEIVPSEIEKLRKVSSGEDSISAIQTGFPTLDKLIGGLRESELVILAARPSLGKTALALNIAKNAALRGEKVLFFSLEMSKEALTQRLLADIANMSFSSIRNGELAPDELQTVQRAGDVAKELPITIDDRSGLDMGQIEARTAQICAKEGVGMVVVDYLQLCKFRGSESRYHEVSEISHSLKAISKKYSLPVLALAQLNRAIESRKNQTPLLSDLKESGDIEQDADVILFIGGKREATTRKISVAKHRNGPLGECHMRFLGWLQRFEDIQQL